MIEKSKHLTVYICVYCFYLQLRSRNPTSYNSFAVYSINEHDGIWAVLPRDAIAKCNIRKDNSVSSSVSLSLLCIVSKCYTFNANDFDRIWYSLIEFMKKQEQFFGFLLRNWKQKRNIETAIYNHQRLRINNSVNFQIENCSKLFARDFLWYDWDSAVFIT